MSNASALPVVTHGSMPNASALPVVPCSKSFLSKPPSFTSREIFARVRDLYSRKRQASRSSISSTAPPVMAMATATSESALFARKFQGTGGGDGLGGNGGDGGGGEGGGGDGGGGEGGGSDGSDEGGDGGGAILLHTMN